MAIIMLNIQKLKDEKMIAKQNEQEAEKRVQEAENRVREATSHVQETERKIQEITNNKDIVISDKESELALLHKSLDKELFEQRRATEEKEQFHQIAQRAQIETNRIRLELDKMKEQEQIKTAKKIKMAETATNECMLREQKVKEQLEITQKSIIECEQREATRLETRSVSRPETRPVSRLASRPEINEIQEFHTLRRKMLIKANSLHSSIEKNPRSIISKTKKKELSDIIVYLTELSELSELSKGSIEDVAAEIKIIKDYEKKLNDLEKFRGGFDDELHVIKI